MCANDPDTFIRNEGYHLEEGNELRKKTPRSAIKDSQRPVFRSREDTTFHMCLVTANYRRSCYLGVEARRFNSLWVQSASACMRQWSELVDRVTVKGERKKEREKFGEREMWGEREREGDLGVPTWLHPIWGLQVS